MAINPFTKPAEAPILDTYVSDYVPLPFAEIAQSGAMKQARYEEGLAQEEAFQTQLDSLSGATNIVEPGTGRQVRLNDSDVIRKFQSDFRSQIDELASNITDKSSPEFRSKIRALIGAYRREAGPNGRIGIAQRNMKTIQDFYQRMEDNPQMQANKHLYAPFIQKIRAHEARTRQGVIQPLDLSGAMGKGVDINKKLTDVLKHVAASELRDPQIGQYSGNLPGLIAAMQSKGVTRDRIQAIVSDTLVNDPEIANDIRTQAQYNVQTGMAQQRFGDLPAEELMMKEINDVATSYMRSMSNIFAHEDIDMKTFYDQDYMAKAKKKLDKEEELLSAFSRNVVSFKPGTGIENSTDLRQAQQIADSKIRNAKDAFVLAIKDKNLELNEDGTVKDWVKDMGDGTFKDYSIFFQKELDDIKNAEMQKESLAELERDLKSKAGITPLYLESPEHQKSINEARSKAQDLIVREQRELGNPEPVDSILSKFDADVQEATNRYLPSIDDRYKKFQELLKKESKDGTFVAGVTGLKGKMEESLVDLYMKDYSQIEGAVGTIKELQSGKEVTDYKDMYIWGDGDIEITEKNKPDFVGYMFDDAENGALKLVYNLKNKNGEVASRVKIDAPTNFEDMLIEAGDVDRAYTTINRKLVGEFGALGVLRREQTLNISPEGPLFAEPGTHSKKILVQDKGSYGGKDTRYVVTTANSEGVEVPVPLPTKKAVIAYIAKIATEYKTEQLNKKLKKQQ